MAADTRNKDESNWDIMACYCDDFDDQGKKHHCGCNDCNGEGVSRSTAFRHRTTARSLREVSLRNNFAVNHFLPQANINSETDLEGCSDAGNENGPGDDTDSEELHLLGDGSLDEQSAK